MIDAFVCGICITSNNKITRGAATEKNEIGPSIEHKPSNICFNKRFYLKDMFEVLTTLVNGQIKLETQSCMCS